MRFGNDAVYFLNINITQSLSGPWQASSRVARCRLAHEHPKAVWYIGAQVRTGTQGGQMTGPQQMLASSPAVVIGPFFAGTMIQIEKKPSQGIDELKTAAAVGLRLVLQPVKKNRRRHPRRRTQGEVLAGHPRRR